MTNNLVIVESPAKAKTIEKFLGKDFTVKSSFGHIRDLEKKGIGIDIAHDFKPQYVIAEDKDSIVKELSSLAQEAKTIWLASDEDREGEAIAWHLFEVLNLKPENTKRIVFHEITKDAIIKAIENPRSIDINLVNAQQARRVLDRIVGFEISPVLWRKVKPALSAGRVQSVAVKLIVEREREINSFKSHRYYKISGVFNTDENLELKAEIEDKFDNKETVVDFLNNCKDSVFSVKDVDTKPAVRKSAPPFTTSTLQQEASRKLGFSVSQTMSIAQKLYEHGHITYMRTDSVNLSEIAISAAKKVITETMGKEYSNPRHFTTRTKGAQEAHEAIRPTYMDKNNITGEKNEQALYDLIYKRTLASQMSDAKLERTTVIIVGSKLSIPFLAIGEVVLFDGFLKMYRESSDDDTDEERGNLLPKINVGDKLGRKRIIAAELYTAHPPRYTEASLVKKMETLGIGRPSTYAPTITNIQNRGYIVRESRGGVEQKFEEITLSGDKITTRTTKKIVGAEKKKLFPSNTGIIVTDFLAEHFPLIMDYNFTANVEENFDEIAEGEKEWTKMMSDFYSPFHEKIEITMKETGKSSGERELGVEPSSGEKLIVRIGRFGPIAQIGQGENARYAPLKKEQLMETITLEEALELFRFPRKLGTYEDKEVSIGLGRFGPYIKHDNKYISLKKGVDSPETIDLETAVQRIEDKRENDKNRFIKEFEGGIQLLNGRFGPYISYENKNYRIPKTVNTNDLTLEDVLKLIEDGDKRNPKPAQKKTTTKKKSTTNKK
ncbi:MAG: type I DNA topoisomerase [Culturomica sp.]|jgi:DNA topoisomerase-1|nr:type I DNA topoisomerase [Culturomica sp.]